MKEIKISSSAIVYNDIEELSKDDKFLMNKAIDARKKAYAPYSKFNVGAALLLENGEIVLGNNQENAAYPSGMCAERVAIWAAGATYPGVKIIKLAISASSTITKVDKPVGPCGACRQSLSEYEIKQKQAFPLLFMGEVGEIVKTESLLSLLPFSFDSSYL
ncbi:MULTISPECIES: cytidine deaminase [Polaribacter]|uniref:Cytidine deaminase n=1 Tax=Polaribacter marinaquae TaxID=1642819 RepID=A0ABZ2TUV1_9FLAO|nr:cytidine deaminase [Polaribacter sp. KT 15]SHN01184.1 cytidine deaminase [Polaribacter sp. KT 15]